MPVSMTCRKEGVEAEVLSGGERANDANKMMRTIAAKMTDEEIHAVADYIAGSR